MVVELDHIVRGGETEVRTRGMIASRSVRTVRHPQGSFTAHPVLVSGFGNPGKQVKPFDAAMHTCKEVHTRGRSPPHKRLIIGCRSPFRRLAEPLRFRFALGATNVLPGR